MDPGFVRCEFCNAQIQVSMFQMHIQYCPTIDLQSDADTVTDDGIDEIDFLPTPISHRTLIIDRAPPAAPPFSAVMTPVSRPITIGTSYEDDARLAEFMGNVVVGIDIPERVLKPARSTDPSELCAICQEFFTKTSSPIVKTLCHHIYCSECIQDWLKCSKKCPVCMMDLQTLADLDGKKHT